MQGVIGHSAQLAVGLHHAGHVGVLDGDDDVVEIELLQQADMVQGAFHHGLGHGRAVLCQDVLFQAAAVHTDADGDVLLLAGLHHGLDPVVVADVAGVDADLVHTNVGAGQRCLVVKVDIRHDGDVHRVLHGLDALGIRRAGAGHTQDLAARRLTALCLGNVALNVLHGDIQHGLHRNGVVAANGHIADLHFSFQLPHGRFPFRITLPR